MSILIDAQMLLHEGGTKFYEVISYWNEDTKKGIYVKRWGKVSARDSGGGQIDIRDGVTFLDFSSVKQKALDIIRSKKNRGYDTDSMYKPRKGGLYDSSPMSEGQFDGQVARHYNATSADKVRLALGLSSSGAVNSEAIPVDDQIQSEVTETEVDRGEEWASW